MLMTQTLGQPFESGAGWGPVGKMSKFILRIFVDFCQDDFLSLAG